MDQVVARPLLSEAEMTRRRDAVEWARAANIRQGYRPSPTLEVACDRFVRGEISLDEFGAEMRDAALVRAQRRPV